MIKKWPESELNFKRSDLNSDSLPPHHKAIVIMIINIVFVVITILLWHVAKRWNTAPRYHRRQRVRMITRSWGRSSVTACIFKKMYKKPILKTYPRWSQTWTVNPEYQCLILGKSKRNNFHSIFWYACLLISRLKYKQNNWFLGPGGEGVSLAIKMPEFKSGQDQEFW